MTDYCTVLLTNDAYFERMLHTLSGILQFVCSSDIVIVIGDDLRESTKLSHPLLRHEKVKIQYFPDIKFSDNFNNKFNTLHRTHWTEKFLTKKFQYHKFNIFNQYFKQWKFILYIDSGATIFSSIDRMFNARRDDKFCAHSDGYPNNPWFLKRQFDDTDSLFSELANTYNLEIDYPQTTIKLFDTNLIEENTFNEIYDLAEKWPISLTNDQGILALYFTAIKNKWEQIQLGDEDYWYYDFHIRPTKVDKPHVIVKYV